MLKRYIKGLLEDRRTKQNANVGTIMTSKKKAGFGFIKGFIRFRHTIASAFVIIPTTSHGIISPINPDGIGLISKISVSTGIQSNITSSAGLISIMSARGKGLKSTITSAGKGILSTIRDI